MRRDFGRNLKRVMVLYANTTTDTRLLCRFRAQMIKCTGTQIAIIFEHAFPFGRKAAHIAHISLLQSSFHILVGGQAPGACWDQVKSLTRSFCILNISEISSHVSSSAHHSTPNTCGSSTPCPSCRRTQTIGKVKVFPSHSPLQMSQALAFAQLEHLLRQMSPVTVDDVHEGRSPPPPPAPAPPPPLRHHLHLRRCTPPPSLSIRVYAFHRQHTAPSVGGGHHLAGGGAGWGWIWFKHGSTMSHLQEGQQQLRD